MRPVRRPAVVAQYAAQIAEWLRERPTPSAAELLRRVRRAGYRGGKSALYELVRRVRTGSQQLVIVARDRQHLFNVFARAFEGNATVRVVLDRRVTERRGQHAVPHERERRQRNRRSPDTPDAPLRAMGWTIVRMPVRKIIEAPPLERPLRA